MSLFKKATKQQAFLRGALFGPSGAGKTFSMLRVLTGIAKKIKGKVAVVDSEQASAAKYSDRFDFDHCILGDRSIDSYCEAINDAGKQGYVLGIDSLSHAWQELLIEVEKLAKAKYRGNTWSAWSEGTPKQRKLVDAITGYPGHIIATMRSKTEWVQEEDSRTGKKAPKRVGLAPEQGKGIEYEFDFLMEISPEHFCSIIKDRSGKFQDKIIEKPDESFGGELAAWLSEGEAPKTPLEVIKERLAEIGKTEEDLVKALLKADKIPPDTESLASVGRDMLSKIEGNWTYALKLLK